MAREIRVPITPSVLQWAMAEAGYDARALAAELGTTPGTVGAWLSGTAPSLGEFRSLAHLLRRPTATFLLPAPPKDKRPQVAFRRAAGEPDRALEPRERLRIREVTRLQRIVGWLLDQLGDAPTPLPKLKTAEAAEVAGGRLRELLGVRVQTQLEEWKGEGEAARAWRGALENASILVFFLPMGGEAARGFSLFDERAPAIAVNTHFSQTARIYTMIHEVVHLLTRTNSICWEPSGPVASSEEVERWCEAVAAACLMPRSAVSDFLSLLGGRPITLSTASRMARRFKVSLRAAALRLVSLGHANWGLFLRLPASSDLKKGGGGGGGRKRARIRLDEYGKKTTSVVLRGLQGDIISRSDAMSVLDVSYQNIDDLAAAL